MRTVTESSRSDTLLLKQKNIDCKRVGVNEVTAPFGLRFVALSTYNSSILAPVTPHKLREPVPHYG
jgi:hypothetical protein